jgi:hypothetical protein
MNISELREHCNRLKQTINALGAGTLFKDKIRLAYSKWMIEQFERSLNSANPQEALMVFFKNNWTLVSGSLVSPTAMPGSEVVLFLCKVANWLSNENNIPPVQIVFPDIACTPLIDDYPELGLESTIPLEEILKTHIVSDDQKSLIPIFSLVDFTNTKYKGNYFKPYDEQYQPLSNDELKRLEHHSKMTEELTNARLRFTKLNEEDTNNLYSQLTSLCARLRLEDAHGGRGHQKQVGERAFVALSQFGAFYERLSTTQKEIIPPSLAQAINKLLDVSSNYTGDMTAKIETCAGSRRMEIESAMAGHDALLLSLVVGNKEAELTQAKEQSETLKQDLANALQINDVNNCFKH